MPNFTNRIPQGRGSRGGVGAYLEESLPNVTGSLLNIGGTDALMQMTNGQISESGALYGSSYEEKFFFSLSTSKNRMLIGFSLDASRSSSTYKDNAPVQQAATVVNFCIRY